MRNYKSEYKNYHSKPKQKKNRASRNGARRIMKKKLHFLPSKLFWNMPGACPKSMS